MLVLITSEESNDPIVDPLQERGRKGKVGIYGGDRVEGMCKQTVSGLSRKKEQT